MAKKQADLAAHEEEQKTAASSIVVGNRCKVEGPRQPTKLATVMYVGRCSHSISVLYRFVF